MNNTDMAIELALNAASERPDADVAPVVKSTSQETHFVLVDVQYSSRGFCALYEYDTRNNSIVLAQD